MLFARFLVLTEANVTRANNGQIDRAVEPGCRQNRRQSQLAVVASVIGAAHRSSSIPLWYTSWRASSRLHTVARALRRDFGRHFGQHTWAAGAGSVSHFGREACSPAAPIRYILATQKHARRALPDHAGDLLC